MRSPRWKWSPRGPTGLLTGILTSEGTGAPLAGATVTARASGLSDRTATADASGVYNLVLPVGSYALSARTFGYREQHVNVTISEAATTTQNFTLFAAPSHALSGTVRDEDGAPISGVRVTVLGTPIAAAITDGSGAYMFASVPEGDYDVQAAPSRCYGAQTSAVSIAGNTTLHFDLPTRVDAYGYSCAPVAFNYANASQEIATSGDEDSFPVDLPFTFTYYGKSYDSVNVAVNGVLHFLPGNVEWWNTPIPSPLEPNAAIYGFWDDLYLDGTGSIAMEVLGSAPNRRAVFEWRHVAFYGSSEYVDFEIVLEENGGVCCNTAAATPCVRRASTPPSASKTRTAATACSTRSTKRSCPWARRSATHTRLRASCKAS